MQSIFYKELNIYFLYFYDSENTIQIYQLAQYLKSIWLCCKWGISTYTSNHNV